MPSPQHDSQTRQSSDAAHSEPGHNRQPVAPVAEHPKDAERTSSLSTADMAEIFGPSGPVSRLLAGYEERPSQTAMAVAVQQAILEQRHALIEAPTGTGKSIAYLIPAVLSGKKVVVATANKSLQAQLFAKDIPFVGQALDHEIDAVVVKGRSNFLCQYKWEKELEEQRMFSLYDREADQIPLLRKWLNETTTGDVDELPFVVESDLRPRIVSFPDDCLQRECPFWDECWVNLMRDHAAQAEVLVTNHHLLLNALELGQEGVRILPPADIYIIDEAHGLEQTATSVYETEVTDYTVEQLLQRTIFRDHVDETALEELRYQNTLVFQELITLASEPTFVIKEELEGVHGLSVSLDDLAQKLRRAKPYGEPKEGEDRGVTEGRRALELATDALASAATKLAEVATARRDGDYVRYGERVTGRRHVRIALHAAPINPAQLLRRYLFERESEGTPGHIVICTSATLSTDGAFEHFKRRCGITSACVEAVLPPVFDYPTQALLYQPALPSYDWKNSDGYYNAAAAEIERLLEVSRGRTLCLFTNWSGLQQVSQRIREGERMAIWPVRSQGDAPREALLNWFRQTPWSVLLATRSFWEGVDIPGDDLSLVVLDKLPFPSPNDPVMSARVREIQQSGADSFGEYITPNMTLALKQGFGRLIRRATDRGVVAILDDRLVNQPYGKRARTNLPPARFTRDFKEVHRFFQRALASQAEFAVNVWCTERTENAGIDWRYQVVRLQDGRADEESGTMAAPPGAPLDFPRAAAHALTLALANLRARVEKAHRSPADFAVEVRSMQELGGLLSDGGALSDGGPLSDGGTGEQPLRDAARVWRSVQVITLAE